MGFISEKILSLFQLVMAKRVGTRKILIPTTFIFSSKDVTRQDLVSVSWQRPLYLETLFDISNFGTFSLTKFCVLPIRPGLWLLWMLWMQWMLLRLQMQADMYAMFDNVQKSLVSFLSIINSITVTESCHYNMTFYEFSLNNTLRKAATTAQYCP